MPTDRLITELKATGAKAYQAAMNDSAAATRSIGTAAEESAKRAERARAQMNMLANGMIAAGMAGVAAFGSMVKVNMEYEKTLSEIKAMSGATAKEMNQLADATRAVELQKLGIGAREAATGLWSFASAGFDVNQQLTALLPTAAAAKALGADFNETSAAGVAIMGQYGLEAKDFESIMQALVGTYQTSQADLGKLNAAFRQAGATLAGFNWDVQESAAAFGILLSAGKQGEQAGTIMRGAMLKLVNPTADAAAALQEVGIGTQELTAALEDPIALIELFSDKTMTQAQATRIFGAESKDLTILLDAGTEAFKKQMDAAGENVDLMEIAGTQTDNLQGAIERLQASWEALATTQGDYVADPLRATIEGLASMLRAYNELPGPIKGVITVLGLATTAALLLGGAYIKLRLYQAQMATAAAARAAANTAANATETASANVLAAAYARATAAAGRARGAATAAWAAGAGGARAAAGRAGAWAAGAGIGAGAAVGSAVIGAVVVGEEIARRGTKVSPAVTGQARSAGQMGYRGDKEMGWGARGWEGLKGHLGFQTAAGKYIEEYDPATEARKRMAQMKAEGGTPRQRALAGDPAAQAARRTSTDPLAGLALLKGMVGEAVTIGPTGKEAKPERALQPVRLPSPVSTIAPAAAQTRGVSAERQANDRAADARREAREREAESRKRERLEKEAARGADESARGWLRGNLAMAEGTKSLQEQVRWHKEIVKYLEHRAALAKEAGDWKAWGRLQEELLREQEAAEDAISDSQDKALEKYKETAKDAGGGAMEDALQAVIGGRLGADVRDAINRLSGDTLGDKGAAYVSRPQKTGGDKIVLEVHGIGPNGEQAKEIAMRWLVPALQDASQQGVPAA